ncbi:MULTISPECIES: restriction endonuclease fold toxin-2 domain-containing protein [unclassified Kitasatospora]|uniref:restriction endonuclease fold toxin-2 domain-containing protein n=1 Tax=unclassified Kitasatospora TaxID=2633591 RepID=UPI00247670F8|nr:restriction endonuclease fold toxin-2 domain-containing protein [Kitasatospora sp. GAS204B]
MLISSAGFTDLQTWASQIHRGLVGSMDDAAGMAGDDDTGHSFAAKYDPAAQAVVTAVGQAVAQLGGTANGLYTMALNYIKTDADVAANLMQPQQLPQSSNPQCDQDPLNVQVPSAVGHNASAVDEIIAQFWPQGDSGKLRQAGSDWKQLAQLVSTLGLEGDKQVQTVTASSTSSAVDSFVANWAKMHDGCATQGPLLNSITNAAFQLGAACESYAQAVDDLCSTLQDLAAGAGVVTGVGIALTIFTLGGSDAAAAAGDAAIAAEAGTAAAAMTAGIEGSADLAVLAEAEAIVNEAAAGLSPIVTTAAVAAGGTAVALASASSAMAAPAPKPPAYTVVPGTPPIPRDPNSPFPVLSSADQATVQAWMAQAAADGRTMQVQSPSGSPKVDARRAYQLRVAGSTEYSLYTTVSRNNAQGGDYNMDADGVRPEDGAAIDAKYIAPSKGCGSPFRLGNAGNVPDYVYQSSLKGENFKIEKYGSAFQDPRNGKINHLEVITNDDPAAAYFAALMAAQNVPGQVRVVP